MKKISPSFVGVIIFSLLGGFVLGYFWGYKATKDAPDILEQSYALAEYETLATLQYEHADSVHGEQALKGLLDFMANIEETHGNAIGRHLALDRAITCMRLALLNEKIGDKQGYEVYLKHALDHINRDGDSKSEQWLRDAVTKLDSRPHYALPAVFLLRRSGV